MLRPLLKHINLFNVDHAIRILYASTGTRKWVVNLEMRDDSIERIGVRRFCYFRCSLTKAFHSICRSVSGRTVPDCLYQ